MTAVIGCEIVPSHLLTSSEELDHLGSGRNNLLTASDFPAHVLAKIICVFDDTVRVFAIVPPGFNHMLLTVF